MSSLSLGVLYFIIMSGVVIVFHERVPTKENLMILSQTRTPNLNLYSMQDLYGWLPNFMMPNLYFGDVLSVGHSVWVWIQSLRSQTSAFFWLLTPSVISTIVLWTLEKTFLKQMLNSDERKKEDINYSLQYLIRIIIAFWFSHPPIIADLPVSGMAELMRPLWPGRLGHAIP